MDDELVNTFTTSLATSSGNQRRYTDLYKQTGHYGHQEERRKKILEEQKKNRNNRWDHFRGISEIVSAAESRLKWTPNYASYYKPSIYVAGFNQVSSNYENVLMLSEWMIEKPSDFHENWYLTPCPKGLRTLLVAAKGITRLFNRYGFLAYDCLTPLPGGSSCTKHINKYSSSVLDGFYQHKNNTFYVLDVLAWNEQNMTDGETEFRHFWIQSKLKEYENNKEINNSNEMHFSVLPKIPCEINQLNNYLAKYPLFENGYPPLDGFLFYHKYAHYFNGETPLVGWLFPYMVPEILGNSVAFKRYWAKRGWDETVKVYPSAGYPETSSMVLGSRVTGARDDRLFTINLPDDITMNPEYLSGKPKNYINQASFIKIFERKLEASRTLKKKAVTEIIEESKKQSNTRRKQNTTKMEVTPSENGNNVKNKSSNIKMEYDESIPNPNSTNDTTTIESMDEQISQPIENNPLPESKPWTFTMPGLAQLTSAASGSIPVPKLFQFSALNKNNNEAQDGEDSVREYSLF